MSPQDGKKLWSAILKKHEKPIEVVVIADDGKGRALSAAMGIVETLGQASATMVMASDLDKKFTKDDKPPNPHVTACVKKSRGLVI